MRLRRRSEVPEPDEAAQDDFAEAVAWLWRQIEENLDRCRRLTEQRQSAGSSNEGRDEALRAARELAYITRTVLGMVMFVMPAESIADGFLPPGVFGAAARLTYALVGLAEEDPLPEQLLTAGQLDLLVGQYELEPWFELFHTARRERQTQ
jgi:hypothetical protein